MKHPEERPILRPAPVSWFLLAAASAGCAPTVNAAGVYFPGWLVSTLAGVFAAYVLVIGLGRRPEARSLAQSGLFFVSLVVVIALGVWWIGFSGF